MALEVKPTVEIEPIAPGRCVVTLSGGRHLPLSDHELAELVEAAADYLWDGLEGRTAPPDEPTLTTD